MGDLIEHKKIFGAQTFTWETTLISLNMINTFYSVLFSKYLNQYTTGKGSFLSKSHCTMGFYTLNQIPHLGGKVAQSI